MSCTAAVWDRPGPRSCVALRMNSVTATLPNWNAAMTTMRRPSEPDSTGLDGQPDALTLSLLRLRRVPDGVEDGDGCEQAGDDGQADGAQVVHSPLEAVRAPVGLRRGDIGKQCVACR